MGSSPAEAYAILLSQAYPVSGMAASQDLKFRPLLLVQEGKMVRSLKGHGHWVNTLALSSEYALRTGAFDHNGVGPSDPVEAQQVRSCGLGLKARSLKIPG